MSTPSTRSTASRRTRAFALAAIMLAAGLAMPLGPVEGPVATATAQTPNPDLAIRDITLSTNDLFPRSGQTIRVTVHMLNERNPTGFATVSQGTAMQLLVEHPTSGATDGIATRCIPVTTPEWPAGNEGTSAAWWNHSFNYDVPQTKKGENRVRITINAGCPQTANQIDESTVLETRRQNNARHFTIIVDEKPNIVVSNVRWCSGGLDPECPIPEAQRRTAYEGQGSDQDPMHSLRASLSNVGFAPQGTSNVALPLTDPGYASASQPAGSGSTNYAAALVPVEFRIIADVNGTLMRSVWSNVTSFSDPVTTGNLPLLGMAGNYTVRVVADGTARIPDANRVTNANATSISVRAVDLVATHDDSILKPGQYGVTDALEMRFAIENAGELLLPGHRTPVAVQLFHVGRGDSREITHANVTGLNILDPGQVREINVTVQLVATREAEDLSQGKVFAGGGQHIFSLHVDRGNGRVVRDGQQIYESNEHNNEATVTIIVQDTVPPTVSQTTVKPPELLPGEASGRGHRTAQAIHFLATVDDNDPTLSNVWVNLTHPDGNVSTYPMTRVGTTTQFEYNLTAGVNQSGQYTFVVCAQDPAENPVQCGPTLSRQISDWPNQRTWLSGSLTPAHNNTDIHPGSQPQYPWEVRFAFRQEDWQVGFPGGPGGNNTEGKRFIFEYPGDAPGSRLYAEVPNPHVDFPASGQCNPPGFGQQEPSCVNRFEYGAVDVVFDYPGLLNVTLETRDKNGVCNCTHWSLWLEDYPPFVSNVMAEPMTGPAGGVVRFRYEISDRTALRETDVQAAYLHFTLPNGFEKNISMPAMTSAQRYDTPDGPTAHAWRTEWELNVTLGAGNDLPFAGADNTYNVTLAAVDKWGNWGRHETFFVILDDVRPTILGSGVSSRRIEVGQDVNFTVRARDNAKLEAFLNVKRVGENDEVIVDRALMNGPIDDTYYLRVPFNTTGFYNFHFEVTDGTFTEILAEDSLEVVRNLPPRVRYEGFVRRDDGQFYSFSRPQMSILVYDSDGVDRDSIDLKVDGQSVAGFSLAPITVPETGYRLTYDFSGFTFRHGDIVNLTVTAQDLSPQGLVLEEEDGSFTFIVDGRPPTTTLTSIQPVYYPEDITQPPYVSPATAIVVAGEDEGRAAAKSWVLLGRGTAKQIIEFKGEPLRLSAFDQVCCRPGVYTLQYWSVDDVGNEEQLVIGGDNELVVELDDEAPIAGRDDVITPPWVNITLIDERSGVQSAFLLVTIETPGRANPTVLDPIPMMYSEPWWRAELPTDPEIVPVGSLVRYRVEAVDNVGNRQEYRYDPWVTGNRAPVVDWREPTSEATVTGEVTLRWRAFDPDGHAITTTLEHKGPGQSAFSSLLTTDSRTDHAIDTTKLANGRHEFRLVVADLHNATSAAVLVLNVRNEIPPISFEDGPRKETIRPGNVITVTAQVNRPATKVLAILFHEGREIGRIPMLDDGRADSSGDARAGDGVYSGRFELRRPGTHEVVIEMEYQDGAASRTYRTEPQDLQFVVQYSTVDVFAYNPGLWGAIGVLTLAVAGVGAFAIIRRKGGVR